MSKSIRITKQERIQSRQWHIDLLVAFLLAAVTAIAYMHVLTNGRIMLDDGDYVYSNPYVQSGLTLRSISWALTSTTVSNQWHPLTWMLHMVDWTLYGPNPMGHHLTPLLFHIANSVLLFFLLQRMTGMTWRSAFAAALFGVHPLHVESVAWISELKDVLSTFLCIVALIAYLRYVRNPRRTTYLLVLALFALGLTAKPMLVTFPFMLLLLDYWPLRRLEIHKGKPTLPLLIEKIPFLALSMASSAITFFAMKSNLRALPITVRLENAAISYVEYALKLIYPHNMSIVYPYSSHIPFWELGAALLSIVSITVLVTRAADRKGYLAMGWLWYLLTLIPVIGLLQAGMQPMADRYSYIPSVGIFIMLAWGLPDLAYYLFPSLKSHRRIMAVFAAVILLCLTYLTTKQVGYWKDDISLFSNAAEVTHDNYLAELNLGAAYRFKDMIEESDAHWIKAAEIAPDNAQNQMNLGVVFLDQGKPDKAVVHFREAARLDPSSAMAHSNLASALAKQGELDEAIEQCQLAIRLDPKSDDPYMLLEKIYSSQGKYEKSVDMLRRATRMRPNNVGAHIRLAELLYSLHDYAGTWAEIKICRSYGEFPPQSFVDALSKKMPEPSQ